MNSSLLALIVTVVLASAAQAAEKTNAIYGPKCDVAKVKELLGNKATKVENGAAGPTIHNVTYDDVNEKDVIDIVTKNCM